MSYIRVIKFLRHKYTIFGIKTGLVAGTVYYISEQGVWKDSDTTHQLFQKIKTNASPYTNEVAKKIPYEFPSLPKSEEISYITKYYWNRGVLATFNFLANIPNYVTTYANKGIDKLLDTKEIKNVVNSPKEKTN